MSSGRWWMGLSFLLLLACGGNRAEAQLEADSSKANASPNLPKPGPVTDGLQLRLQASSEVKNGEDIHALRVEIINRGEKPVALVARNPGGDYSKVIRSSTTFTTIPRVPTTGFSIGLNNLNSLAVRLSPGSSLVSHWQVKGRTLRSHLAQREITFPTEGLYKIKARLTVIVSFKGRLENIKSTKDAKRIQLVSNEQSLVVGGVRKRA